MALAPIAPVAAATTETTGCRSVSADYPWGKAALRTWTPRYVTAPTPYYPIQSMGAPLGQPFQARLVYAFGEAHLPAYDQAVELETADGCRRRFRVSGFSDANVSDIQAEIAAHVTPRDTATYRTDYQTGRGTEAAITAGVLGKYETQHFTFWYGTDRNGDSYKYVTDIVKSDFDSFIRSAGVWAETQWYLQRDVNRAPMPFANATERRRSLSTFAAPAFRSSLRPI